MMEMQAYKGETSRPLAAPPPRRSQERPRSRSHGGGISAGGKAIRRLSSGGRGTLNRSEGSTRPVRQAALVPGPRLSTPGSPGRNTLDSSGLPFASLLYNKRSECPDTRASSIRQDLFSRQLPSGLRWREGREEDERGVHGWPSEAGQRRYAGYKEEDGFATLPVQFSYRCQTTPF